MNEIQSFLRENDPEHPMRVFGEAVEASEPTASSAEVVVTPPASSQVHPTERMPELSRSFQAGYVLQAVWPGEAALEELVLEKLKPFTATVGTSREHFDSRVTLGHLFKIVDHARVLYKEASVEAQQL
jgi:hypothetical protein